MDRKHTVKSYDAELELLSSLVTEMYGLCRSQLAKASQALAEGAQDLADEIVAGDQRINDLERQVDSITVRMLAKRLPVAVDLRLVIGSLRIASDLERIADYCRNIGHHVKNLGKVPQSQALPVLIDMAAIDDRMLAQAEQSFLERDRDLAVGLDAIDDEVDELYREVLDSLRVDMAASAETVEEGSILLFVSRCLERIGDHITKLGDHVHFILTGHDIEGEIPTKG